MVIVAPHPDDEIIGAGAHMPAIRDLWIVHATDGAPRNMQEARKNGFATREEYAQARAALQAAENGNRAPN